MILLSGATGFLGMEVLARLLERTDRKVMCVVRAADHDAAEERLDGVLGALYRDPSPYRARVQALHGDLTSGVREPEEPVDVVCHCAASITFDLPLEEARETNVDGTRAMLALARDAGARRFVHVSTAYVAGTHSGRFTEDMFGSEFRNTYEQTKCEAERVVGAVEDMDVAIARPSIVMGESETGWTPAFNVLYWPLRAFARGLFEQVPALPDGRVDVVPVDYVADGIAKLIEVDATGTFNLVAGDEAATVEELSDMACTHFGRPRPPYAQTGGSAGAAADRARRRVPPVLRHGRRVRRRQHAPGTRDQGAAAARVLRHAARLRRPREVGQARHVARGGAGAGGGSRPLIRGHSAQVVVGDLDVEGARHVRLDHLGDALVPTRLLGRRPLQEGLDLLELDVREADRHDLARVVEALPGHDAGRHAEPALPLPRGPEVLERLALPQPTGQHRDHHRGRTYLMGYAASEYAGSTAGSVAVARSGFSTTTAIAIAATMKPAPIVNASV